MNQLTKRIFLAACSVAGLMTLGACGGSDNPASPTLTQTITFISPGNQNLLQAPPALVATATSGLPVVFASTTPSVCTVSGTTLTLVSVGTCTVGAAQLGDDTYAPAPLVSNTFTVSVLLTAQTITFASPGNQTLGTAPGALVATSTSGLTVAFASTTPTICTASGTALTLLLPGTCTIAASQAGNSTYSAAPIVPQSFSVAATPQTITFVSPGNKTLGTAPFGLVATASSNLPVAFASTTTGVCTVSGTTLTLVAAGQCTVNANQAGNATYAAAPTVPQTFTVSAAVLASQTINFTSPANVTVGTPVTLGATATSGLPVTYTSGTLPVCTVNGSTLTPVSVGNCTITASQSGNSTFAAAAPVSNTFAVAAAVATVNAFANGGFEAAATLPNEFAASWRGTSLNTTRSNAEAHSGSWSALLAVPDPGLGGTGLFQNSVEQGLLIPVSAVNWGTSPTLSFWLKGNSSETGSLTYALRYLDATGNILNTAGGSSASKSIWTGNSIRGWTLFTRTPNTAIPNGTTAVFLEMTLAVGPTGVQPPGNCGVDNITGLPNPCDYGQAQVYVDDVNLQLLP